MTETPVTTDKLVSDLKTVVEDAEALVREAATATGEKASELHKQAMDKMAVAREKLAGYQTVAGVKAREAGRAADACVRKHPWETAGVAAALGLALGVLIGRR